MSRLGQCWWFACGYRQVYFYFSVIDVETRVEETKNRIDENDIGSYDDKSG
jgi:hypothetical protein